MKKRSILLSLLALPLVFLAQGCQQKGGVWDSEKNAARMTDRDSDSYWEGEGLANREDGVFGFQDEEYILLSDDDLKSQFADAAIPQPNKTPGEAGSGIPGIKHFQHPEGILASIFRTVHFNTNDHIIRSHEYLSTLNKVSEYLINHPNTYIFVAGGCDERGPEAYNLALGTRRANYVRTLLVKKGVNPNQIYTISYGKEKPVDPGHNHRAWAKNRRAEFKLFEK